MHNQNKVKPSHILTVVEFGCERDRVAAAIPPLSIFGFKLSSYVLLLQVTSI